MCIRFKTECHFPTPKGKLNKRDEHEAPTQTDVHLRTILDLLRRSSADECNEILDRIRLAPSVDDFVETFAGSGLFLPRVSQGTGL
jgi:hypothetical protein